MEPSTISSLVTSMGLPTAILVLLALAIWKTLRWCAPRIERLFEAHINLVEDLRVQSAQAAESNAETLRVSKETLSLIKETRERRAI